jgi:predicted transcriptional regulator
MNSEQRLAKDVVLEGHKVRIPQLVLEGHKVRIPQLVLEGHKVRIPQRAGALVQPLL